MTDPFLFQYMEDRRKQKWQRCKKNNKAELNCLGVEPVQTANSRNGKKVSETEALPLCSHIRCDWRNYLMLHYLPFFQSLKKIYLQSTNQKIRVISLVFLVLWYWHL